MNDTPPPPLTHGELADRIVAALNHGLWFAEADPDSVLPETVNAVLAAVQPELDRLRGELDENVGVMRALRRQRDQAEAELARLRACDCYPHPYDHADRCPIYQAAAPAGEEW